MTGAEYNLTTREEFAMNSFKPSGVAVILATVGLLISPVLAQNQSPVLKPPTDGAPTVKLNVKKDCRGLPGLPPICSLTTPSGTVLLQLTPKELKALKRASQ